MPNLGGILFFSYNAISHNRNIAILKNKPVPDRVLPPLINFLFIFQHNFYKEFREIGILNYKRYLIKLFMTDKLLKFPLLSFKQGISAENEIEKFFWCTIAKIS